MTRAPILIFIIIAANAVAQTHSVRKFTVDDGLSSNHVYEVKQDSKGFYWIATNHGVVKYDGYKFRKCNGPFGDDVWWTYEDSKKRIWAIGVGKTLWYLENDSLKPWKLDLNEIERNVTFKKMYEDEFSNFWILSGSKLIRFGKDYPKLFRHKEIRNGLPVSSVFPGFPELQKKDGQVFLVTKLPVEVWKPQINGKLKRLYSYPDSIYNIYEDSVYNSWNSVDRPYAYSDANTTFILRSQDSIFTLKRGMLTGLFNGERVDLGKFPEHDLLQNKNYKVFSLSDKYVFVHSSGSFITDINFNSIAPSISGINNINTVYEDRDGGIWFSTVSDGLCYIPKDGFNATTIWPKDEEESEVVSIESTSEGHVWVVYRTGKLCRLENGKLNCSELSSKHDNDLSWFVRDAEILNNKILVVVGNYELQSFNIESNTPILENIINFNLTRYLSRVSEDTCYLSDYFGSYSFVYRSDSIETQKITSQRNKCFVKTACGEFLQSYEGLYHVNSKGDSISFDSNIIAERFEIAPSGKIWVIGINKGVQLVENDTIISIDFLADKVVKDLHFEGDSVLLVATNQGIIKSKKNVVSGRYEYDGVLTMANGLITNNVTAIHSDRKKIYIGTSRGLNVYNRKRATTSAVGHNVELTVVWVKGNKLPLTDRYNLEPDQNSVDIEYVYISPQSQGLVTYEYKLDGIDDDWKTTNETRISYPFLPAGNYRFQLKAKDLNGVPSTENVDIRIEVKQFWYKTTWFLVLAFIAFGSVVALAFLIRFRQIRQKELEQTKTNNRIAEMRLTALRSQMNPHFVFNVLNSIQEAFLTKNVLEANKHIADFSKLMRLFLESSDDKYITIAKELELLTYYLDLEQMRLDKKFEYEFDIDDDLDPAEFKLPTMILQPLVENAILHGLRYKDGNGRLKISFNLEKEDTLKVVIEDNGIGRKKSSEINATRKKKHESKASSIIEERISIINTNADNNIEFYYVDLENETEPYGTKVVLTMNLIVNQ